MPQDVRLVSIRQRRWQILDARSYDSCRLLTVAPAAGATSSDTRAFLTPFDDAEPVSGRRTLRRVGRTRWRLACRTLLAATAPPGGLRSVHSARADVLPHQLEPALAIVRGLATRVLLADEVGLGKTIQAGIVAAELFARRAIERVLVLTPSGLRDQWAGELASRFSLPALVVDAAAIRRIASALPLGVNPWATLRMPVVSLDYAKRPDVLAPIAACRWDLVIVDEAHGAAGDSDRRSAADAIAARSAYVLLLTATPHSGDDRTFAALCDLGRVNDDALLVFRRTRADVRPTAHRRVRSIAVRTSHAERRLHALLARYTAAVCGERPDAWLAASVLHKRAFSSAWSLAQSLARRIEALERDGDRSPDAQPEQGAFQWDVEGERTTEDEAPVWPAGVRLANAASELRILKELVAAARIASSTDSKVRALERLLHRIAEPAIVFTEFRDTLLHLRGQLRIPSAALHGGLDRLERASAIHDFAERRCRLLLATDAGGEGLNLQNASRLVINLELPWNPVRLEQRIGRVDRIGQQRTVHAIHLIAKGTGEARILARLRKRVAAARAALGAADPIGTTAASGADEERAAARLIVVGTRKGSVADGRSTISFPSTKTLVADGTREAARLLACRNLARSRPSQILSDANVTGPWLTTASRRTAPHLGNTMLLLWQVALLDSDERIVDATVVPVQVVLARGGELNTRASLDRLLEVNAPHLRKLVATASESWKSDAERVLAAFASARLARERAILAAPHPMLLFQPGLFDRRAERERGSAAAARASAGAERLAVTAAFERASTPHGCSATLMLVLAPPQC